MHRMVVLCRGVGQGVEARQQEAADFEGQLGPRLQGTLRGGIRAVSANPSPQAAQRLKLYFALMILTTLNARKCFQLM